MNHPKRFCTYCGREMEIALIGAEKSMVPWYGDLIPVDTKYDAKTGNRNLIRQYTCPKYTSKWYRFIINDKHDQYEFGDIVWLEVKESSSKLKT